MELGNEQANSLAESPPYAGAWTLEEKEYATALIQGFRDGIIPGLSDKATMRNFLAKKLGCLTKRISKKYEKSGYNGRLQYRSGVVALEPEELKMRQDKLLELEKKFLESRKAILDLRVSNGASQPKPANARQSATAPLASTSAGASAGGSAIEVNGLAGNGMGGSMPGGYSDLQGAVAARAAALSGFPSLGGYQDPILSLSRQSLLHSGLLGSTGGTAADILALEAGARQSALYQAALGLHPSALLGDQAVALQQHLALQQRARLESLLGSYATAPAATSSFAEIVLGPTAGCPQQGPGSVSQQRDLTDAILQAPPAQPARCDILSDILRHKHPLASQQAEDQPAAKKARQSQS